VATAGAWIHVAGVYDPLAGEARTYFNGTLNSSTFAGQPPHPTLEALYIGRDANGSCLMEGVIDELRISSIPRYSVSFTPATVFLTDPETTALYHFDEYSGGYAYDESGNGNHAMIYGPSWTLESP